MTEIEWVQDEIRMENTYPKLVATTDHNITTTLDESIIGLGSDRNGVQQRTDVIRLATAFNEPNNIEYRGMIGTTGGIIYLL